LQATCVGMIGAALTLAPISAASAHTKKHQGSSHVKGSNPHSALCADVKSEQNESSGVGSAMEKAIASGNFAATKAAILKAYAADAGDVQKALGVISTAPANVQSAFKNILTYVQQIRTDIENSTSLQGLLMSFESLGKDPKLVTDGTTITNWYTSVCGGSLVTTTTVSIPSS
jgi:hypothetical protein